MLYTRYSLNGPWQMDYQPEPYASSLCPEFKGQTIPHAVPGYWEDMVSDFASAPFFSQLQFSQEHRRQHYPIAGDCPDMALPNILGNFFYRRSFFCHQPGKDGVFHFEGVQNALSLWLNGSFLGRHEGYSTPFDIPIPDGLLHCGENTLTLSVSNHTLTGFDGDPVSGLTSRAANEFSGGITADAELRFYQSPLRDACVLISDDCSRISVLLTATDAIACHWTVLDGDRVLKEGTAHDSFYFDASGLAFWSPEDPKRYTLRITCGDAVLEKQFGLRRLIADGAHFRLNGVPYYLRGVCEHCYYPNTVHPTRGISFYRDVIKKLKALGFNFIRFHTHIPPREYLQAADELGMLVQAETPNNTSYGEWAQIVRFCREYTCVVIYCGGNELYLSDDYLAHFRECAELVHRNTDALFSPMSALRGFEYSFSPQDEAELETFPFPHNPRRFAIANDFADMYNSYSRGHFSYTSDKADPEAVSRWHIVYEKPRVTHEICIDSTYTDLRLADSYRGTRIGQTDMFDSIRRHLAQKGVLEKAPLYFQNSCQWQRRCRKYCFEAVRRCENMAGYDFLGPIDTHWHTFGYDVGMMNEFYEMKPGETLRNVRRYNSETVLLNDLGLKTNFASGDFLQCNLLVSYYGSKKLTNGEFSIRLSTTDGTIFRRQVSIHGVESGSLAHLYALNIPLPEVTEPQKMMLQVTLDGDNLYAENEWELYLFPKVDAAVPKNLLVADDLSENQLLSALEQGRDVVLFGPGPFTAEKTSWRLSLAGRTSGHVATVISDHPIFRQLPHEGYCGWQFASLLEGGHAAVLEQEDIPFQPIVELVTPHKNVVRQAALFEYKALSGRLLVCSFCFRQDDPAAAWLKNSILRYAASCAFAPAISLSKHQLTALLHPSFTAAAANSNFAHNPNDKTSKKKNK